MRLNLLTLASFASAVAGQTLLEALESEPTLSNLTAYLSLYPSFLSQATALTNITFLAPSNEAFAAALNSPSGIASSSALVSALFSYHILDQVYSNFSTLSQFVPTVLYPGEYANVTGGQIVEVISASNDSNSTTTFFSGLYQNATLVPTSSTVNSTNSTTNMTISTTEFGTVFSGGKIFVVDRFLTLPETASDTAIQLNLQSAVGALQVAGLAEVVDTVSDVTIFLPDNAAFQAIGAYIATSTTEELTNILEYHVVNGSVLYSTGLENGTTLTAMNGIGLDITRVGGELFVNSAKVLTPNVIVANGVVHVIQNVLNPGNRTAVVNPSASTQAPAFGNATSASDVPFTSGVPTATSAINTDGPSVAVSSAQASASSSSKGGAMPLQTGAMGAAALFGGAAAFILNI